jgi:hypothetical protein
MADYRELLKKRVGWPEPIPERQDWGIVPYIMDGDTRHAPDGNSVYDALQAIKLGSGGLRWGMQVTIKDATNLYVWGGHVEINGEIYNALSQITVPTGTLTTYALYYIYVKAPGTGTTLSAGDFQISATIPEFVHAKGAYYKSGDGNYRYLARYVEMDVDVADPPDLTIVIDPIALTVPDMFTLLTVGIPTATIITEAPISIDTISLSVPSIPTVAATAKVYVLADTDGVCTISHADPAVVSIVGHGLADEQEIIFQTSGTLPAPLVASTTAYFVVEIGADSFGVSLTAGGSPFATTTDGSGTHKVLGKA